MNSGIQNLVISLGAMQGSSISLCHVCPLKSFLVARKIPFDDPEVLNYVRLGYVVSQLVMLGVYYYVSYTVRIHWLFQFHLVL